MAGKPSTAGNFQLLSSQADMRTRPRPSDRRLSCTLDRRGRCYWTNSFALCNGPRYKHTAYTYPALTHCLRAKLFLQRERRLGSSSVTDEGLQFIHCNKFMHCNIVSRVPFCFPLPTNRGSIVSRSFQMRSCFDGSGDEFDWVGLVRVDGQVYRWLGRAVLDRIWGQEKASK